MNQCNALFKLKFLLITSQLIFVNYFVLYLNCFSVCFQCSGENLELQQLKKNNWRQMMQMTHDLSFFEVEHHNHHLKFLHLHRNFLFLNLRQKLWIVLKQQMKGVSFCFLYFPLSSLRFYSKYHHQFDTKSLLQQLPLPLSFYLQRLKLKSGIIRTQASFLPLSIRKIIFEGILAISVN